jgi:3-methyladenine DNA glycosylase AlkD
MTYLDLRKELEKLASASKASVFKNFFKTGPGQYGEGDKFYGLSVPAQRELAKKYDSLSYGDLTALLASSWHEERLTALLILVRQFQQGGEAEQQVVVRFYLSHLNGVNNWDLVDTSAYNILGAWLLKHDELLLLDKLSSSRNLWERRIAIIATLAFIKQGQLDLTFKLADKLLGDHHDLMHKAVGWMLREAGKRDQPALVAFLEPRYQKMPRTMLRYAIEKFTPAERDYYLGRNKT